VTPEQIALVRDSFAGLAAGGSSLAAPFFAEWRALNPTVDERLDLGVGMDETAFGLELAGLLGSLRDTAGLQRRARRIGGRPGVAAMRPSDYSTGRLALVTVVEQALGPRLDAPTREAWTLATNLITECLRTAGEAAPSVRAAEQAIFGRVRASSAKPSAGAEQ
jgi:hypothetical protein